jgi:ABC-2 type transport system permease protein
LAHQWWGHQVIGADMQGSVVMMETMAQYSALMIMKQRYGVDKMKKFLRYEMNMYLSSRAFESEKELPLYRVEGQSYVYYRKGSVIMYALQDYIGEHKLDSILHQYVHDVRFQNPPYTNSLQFLSYISSAVPDSMKYLMNDMFKSIIVFNNKTTKAEWKRQADSTYKVHIEVESHKFAYDSAGNEKEVALNEWADIGVFGQPKDGAMTPMYMQKKKITQSKQEFDITVAKKPYEAGIDPYFKLIDKHPDDNVMTLTEAK